ncbi:MAG: WG repeat-containing protein [Oscillospiraceae bacterium]|nr:WG repeat-containing protein [Oscillospiraceae bacterium]
MENIRAGNCEVEKAGKWGVEDEYGREVIPCCWDWIVGYGAGYWEVTKGRYSGIYDDHGKPILKAEWDSVTRLGSDCWLVWKNKFHGVYDKHGNQIIKADPGDIRILDNNWIRFEENNLYGLCNINGKKILDIEWDAIAVTNENMILAGKGGKTFLYDREGNQLPDDAYDKLRAVLFEKDISPAWHNGAFRFIDSEFNTIISPAEVMDIRQLYTYPASGSTGKENNTDSVAKKLIFSEWEEISHIADGLVRVKKNGRWGYIDRNARLVIPCQWTDAREFCHGLALVINITNDYERKWGGISRSGELVIPYEWNWFREYSDGYLFMVYPESILREYLKHEWYGRGIQLLKRNKDSILRKLRLTVRDDYVLMEHSEAVLDEQGKRKEWIVRYGLMDREYKEITPCCWEQLEIEENTGAIRVCDGKCWSYLKI